jgi:hypothetical protein
MGDDERRGASDKQSSAAGDAFGGKLSTRVGLLRVPWLEPFQHARLPQTCNRFVGLINFESGDCCLATKLAI